MSVFADNFNPCRKIYCLVEIFFKFSKRKLYKLVKTSEHASYDEIQDVDDPKSSLTAYGEAGNSFRRPKIVASCYVARK